MALDQEESMMSYEGEAHDMERHHMERHMEDSNVRYGPPSLYIILYYILGRHETVTAKHFAFQFTVLRLVKYSTSGLLITITFQCVPWTR